MWRAPCTVGTGSNLAVGSARARNLPVIAVFCLAPAFPEATLRACHFMAEGLACLPDEFAAGRIGWKLVVGELEVETPKLARSPG